MEAPPTSNHQNNSECFNPHPIFILDERRELLLQKPMGCSFNPHPIIQLNERPYLHKSSATLSFNPHPIIQLDERINTIDGGVLMVVSILIQLFNWMKGQIQGKNYE